MAPIKYARQSYGNLFILLLMAGFYMLSSCEPFELYTDVSVDPPAGLDPLDSRKAMEMVSELNELMNENELLGMQVCVAHLQQGSWSFSLGTTEPEQEDSVEDDHIFRIGSVTKIYTATLIFRLIEEGFLSLDATLSEFFPEIHETEGVTVRQLLAHTSGIRDIFTLPSIFINASNFPVKQWDPLTVAKACMEKPLRFEPGTDYSYSNTNYIILGMVAEGVTGKPVAELYREYLFGPLSLERTHFVPYDPAPVDLITGYVHRYGLSFSEWYPNKPDNLSWATLGFSSGAMVTTATELAAFLGHLFQGDILLQESLDEMTGIGDGRPKGLAEIGVNGRTWYGHEGEITGFESMALCHLEDGWIITVITNTTPFRIKEAVNVIDSKL